MPKTADALYISQSDEWTFIEFKNGSIKPADIYRKIYDSLIMLNQMGYACWEKCRKDFTYMVVYNENNFGEKYSQCNNEHSNLKIQRYIRKRAKQPRKLFNLDKLEGYLVKKTYTLNEQEFIQEFVKIKEKEEKDNRAE